MTPDYDRLTWFDITEFRHPEKMSNELLSLLDLARAAAGDTPFVITSDWRPEGDGKSHHLGKAVDIRVSSSAARYAILRGAVLAGFRRVGTYYSGDDHKKGHIHLDVNTALDGFPQDVAWIGKSRR